MSTLQLELNTSCQFVSWIREQRLSIAFTTYQTGKFFLIGLRPGVTMPSALGLKTDEVRRMITLEE